MRLLVAEGYDGLLSLCVVPPLLAVDVTLAAWLRASFAGMLVGVVALPLSVVLAVPTWRYWSGHLRRAWRSA